MVGVCRPRGDAKRPVAKLLLPLSP